MSGEDDWVECVLCEEECLHDDPATYSDPSGEWVCGKCVERLKVSDQWERQEPDLEGMTMGMKIWFDTEFIEDGKTIDLISIGMVREDGATLYIENADCDFEKASDWVRENVLPHLKGGRAATTREAIADIVRQWAGNKPEFWGYYADYDWVVLCQLYGTMMDLPKGWPMFCMDIKQACVAVGNPKLPEQGKGEHHALADAKWNRMAHEFVVNYSTPEGTPTDG